MDELKPCPFCGKTPRYLEHKAGFYTERVICDPCGFYIEIDMDDPTAWNRRAEMQAPEGYKLVPIEPTIEQRTCIEMSTANSISDIYKAMLAAAPDKKG